MSSQDSVWCSWHPDRAAATACRGCGRAGCESCIRGGRCAECAAGEASAGPHGTATARPPREGEGLPDSAVLSARLGSAVAARLGTAAIAAVLVLVTVLQEVTGGATGAVSRAFIFVSTWFYWIADSGYEMRGVAEGQIWRIVTSGLVSFGFWPLLLNVAALVLCGSFVERLLGWRRLVVLYLTASVAAALSAYLFDDAVFQWTGAAGPVVGVVGCAVVLGLLSDDRPATQWLGLLSEGRRMRLVVLSGGRRMRWLVVLLVALYAAAAGFEWYGFGWASLAGGALAGAAYAVLHAFLSPLWARRAIAALWLTMVGAFVVRTIGLRSSDLYSGSGEDQGGTMAGWLDYFAAFAVGALLLATVAAIFIRPPSRQQRERQMMAAESAVRAQKDLRGQCPESIMFEYSHQAAEYSLLADERERSSQRRLLLYFVALAVAALVVMALLATVGADYPHSIWFYLWFPAVGVCLPVLGIFAGEWARRSRQHDAYVEFNGPYVDEMVEHVASRQRQLGVLELVTVAGVVVLTIASVANQPEDKLGAAIGCLPLILVIWINTYLADKGQAIKSVFK